ncbi:hypothetical protein [Epilithonimonas hominis]|uniref:hypothetical protein n=1 Tax=Epilithonimonas hominis TaxID=420404 RepID=UPI00289CB2F4|nr:hypothetical protein [Epilithonimonas hominis]
MRNTTKNAKNRRESKFLGARRNSFLTKRTAKLGFSFLKLNKGSISVSKIADGSFNSYKCVFTSKITGRKAFAYGSTFGGAYQNMIRLFNLKYAV